MATNRKHTKPAVSKSAKEAESVAKQMYGSLTLATAPKATATGYIMGACTVLKILIDQAENQGSSRKELKKQALSFIQGI